MRVLVAALGLMALTFVVNVMGDLAQPHPRLNASAAVHVAIPPPLLFTASAEAREPIRPRRHRHRTRHVGAVVEAPPNDKTAKGEAGALAPLKPAAVSAIAAAHEAAHSEATVGAALA